MTASSYPDRGRAASGEKEGTGARFSAPFDTGPRWHDRVSVWQSGPVHQPDDVHGHRTTPRGGGRERVAAAHIPASTGHTNSRCDPHVLRYRQHRPLDPDPHPVPLDDPDRDRDPVHERTWTSFRSRGRDRDPLSLPAPAYKSRVAFGS